MKTFFRIVIGAFAVIWLGIKIFSQYDENNLLNNQASFEIYIEENSMNIDTLFNLPAGTYNP